MHCRRKPLVFISPEYYVRVVPRDYKTILIMQNLGEGGGGAAGGGQRRYIVGDA